MSQAVFIFTVLSYHVKLVRHNLRVVLMYFSPLSSFIFYKLDVFYAKCNSCQINAEKYEEMFSLRCNELYRATTQKHLTYNNLSINQSVNIIMPYIPSAKHTSSVCEYMQAKFVETAKW